jgi:toxin-antitoxin system PIN domain toxin
LILVEANLLVYARTSSLPQHEAARRWLDARLSGTAAVGLPWPSLLAFLRLVTNPRIFSTPESTASAWEQVKAWLGSPVAWIPAPTDRHQEVLGALLQAASSRANLIPDAHLAALAIEHGLMLCSCDSDFARFSGLRWENPLIP